MSDYEGNVTEIPALRSFLGLGSEVCAQWVAQDINVQVFEKMLYNNLLEGDQRRVAVMHSKLKIFWLSRTWWSNFVLFQVVVDRL